MNTDSTPNEAEKLHTKRRKRTIIIVAALVAAALVAFSACLICGGGLVVGFSAMRDSQLKVLLVEALGGGHLDVTGKYTDGKYTSPSGDFSCIFGPVGMRYLVAGESLHDYYDENGGCVVYDSMYAFSTPDISVDQWKMDKSSIPDSESATKEILIDVFNSDFMKEYWPYGEKYQISNASVVETKFINENPLVLFAVIEANVTDDSSTNRPPSITIGYLSFISGDFIYQISMDYWPRTIWPDEDPLTGNSLHGYLQEKLTKFYEGCEFR